MFGFSHTPELIILLLVAVIVLGPKRLPEVGHGLGRMIRNFRQETQGLRDEATSIKNEITSVKDVMHDTLKEEASPASSQREAASTDRRTGS